MRVAAATYEGTVAHMTTTDSELDAPLGEALCARLRNAIRLFNDHGRAPVPGSRRVGTHVVKIWYFQRWRRAIEVEWGSPITDPSPHQYVEAVQCCFAPTTPRRAAFKALEIGSHVISASRIAGEDDAEPAKEEFARFINTAFEAAGELWRIVGEQVVPLDPEPHQDASRRLSIAVGADPRLAATGAAFEEARDQLLRGGTGNAVTDVYRMLEEVLVAFGAHGNSLGKLFRDARKRGLLDGLNQQLDGVVGSLIAFVSATRSDSAGDAHAGGSELPAEEAALVVNLSAVLATWIGTKLPAAGTAEEERLA